MWRRPSVPAWISRRIRYDDQFTCRLPGRRYFISCEVEVPFREAVPEPPLGFIGWLEVSRRDYEAYRWYRRREYRLPAYQSRISGRLANPVPGVPSSFRTKATAIVKRGDPTPYIRWVTPGTALAQRVTEGATAAFWHEAIEYMERGP
jgi:hypothetical protein